MQGLYIKKLENVDKRDQNLNGETYYNVSVEYSM